MQCNAMECDAMQRNARIRVRGGMAVSCQTQQLSVKLQRVRDDQTR